MKNKTKKIVISVACVLFILATIFVLLFSSANYHDIYDMEEVENGVLDLESKDILEHIGTNMMGEWEFYYNKWIVTDNLDVDSDGIINVGDSWKGMIVDGKEIPATGYASYKLTVKNAQVGELLYFGSTNFYVPHAIYINGQLMYAVGEMTKDYSVVLTTQEIREYTYTVENDEDLEVVIEVSKTDRGGLFMPLWLHGETNDWGSYLGMYDMIMYVVVGLMIAFVAFNFLMMLNVDKLYNKSTFAWFMLMLFLRYIVGMDGRIIIHNHNLATPYYPYKISAIIIGAILVVLFIKMVVEYGYITWSKKETLSLAIFFAIASIASEVLKGYSYGWVPTIIGYLSLLYIPIKLAFSDCPKKNYVTWHMICFVLIIAMLCIEYMNLNGALIFGVDSTCSYIICFIVIVGSIDNLFSLKNVQEDWIICKEQFLRAQMTPHYMFNVFSAIMSEYRKDIDVADEYMVEFCDNMRNCIDLKNDASIDFLEDIKILQEQIKLINVAKGDRVKVSYQLNETEFKLPTFALQPLVENAIMHRGGTIKEFIEITISSNKVGENIEISVQDNGNGFDEKNIPKGSTGIKNCRTRLELLSNAKLIIESKKGNGTKATIILPIKEK